MKQATSRILSLKEFLMEILDREGAVAMQDIKKDEYGWVKVDPTQEEN